MSYAWKMQLGAAASWAILIGLALLGLVIQFTRWLFETVIVGGLGLVLLAILALIVIAAVFGGAAAGLAVGTALRHALGLPVMP